MDLKVIPKKHCVKLCVLYENYIFKYIRKSMNC